MDLRLPNGQYPHCPVTFSNGKIVMAIGGEPVSKITSTGDKVTEGEGNLGHNVLEPSCVPTDKPKKMLPETPESAVDRHIKEMLGLQDQPCLVRLDIETNDLNIDCSDRATVNAILLRRKAIAAVASRWQAPYINLLIGGRTASSFPPELTVRLNGRTMLAQDRETLPFGRNSVLEIPDLRTLYELATADPDLKVVRFARQGSRLLPGAGIIAGSNCSRSSGLDAQAWAGRNMDVELDGGLRTWIPDEWERFAGKLLDHSWLPGFEWEAFLYSGERVRMHGNVQLAWNHGLIRLVKILDCVPV